MNVDSTRFEHGPSPDVCSEEMLFAETAKLKDKGQDMTSMIDMVELELQKLATAARDSRGDTEAFAESCATEAHQPSWPGQQVMRELVLQKGT